MPKRRKAVWDAQSVRGLRRHLDLTQEQLAGELGVRQQTVSEWETGAYRPRGASGRVLSIVAERAGFPYDAGGVDGGRGTPGAGSETREAGRTTGHNNRLAESTGGLIADRSLRTED